MTMTSANVLTDWTVEQIMERDVVTVEATTPVSEVADLFVEKAISGAPVVDHQGFVIGVVSQTDIVREVARAAIPKGGGGDDETGGAATGDDGPVSAYFRDATGRVYAGPMTSALRQPERVGSRAVREIMLPARFHVRPTTSIAGLARYLLNAKVHRALVMKGEKLLGIVTTFDLLHAIASATSEEADLPE